MAAYEAGVAIYAGSDGGGVSGTATSPARCSPCDDLGLLRRCRRWVPPLAGAGVARPRRPTCVRAPPRTSSSTTPTRSQDLSVLRQPRPDRAARAGRWRSRPTPGWSLRCVPRAACTPRTRQLLSRRPPTPRPSRRCSTAGWRGSRWSSSSAGPTSAGCGSGCARRLRAPPSHRAAGRPGRGGGAAAGAPRRRPVLRLGRDRGGARRPASRPTARGARRRPRPDGGRVRAVQPAPWARVHEGDLDAALPADLRGRVDVLVANAPYVPSGEIGSMPAEARVHEPRWRSTAAATASRCTVGSRPVPPTGWLRAGRCSSRRAATRRRSRRGPVRSAGLAVHVVEAGESTVVHAISAGPGSSGRMTG